VQNRGLEKKREIYNGVSKTKKDYNFSNAMVFKTMKFVVPKHFMAL